MQTQTKISPSVQRAMAQAHLMGAILPASTIARLEEQDRKAEKSKLNIS